MFRGSARSGIRIPNDVLKLIFREYIYPVDRTNLFFTCKQLNILIYGISKTLITPLRRSPGYAWGSAKNGYLDLIKISNIDKHFHLILRGATTYGHLHILEWVYPNSNFKWPGEEDIVSVAAEYGHLEVLQWLVCHKVFHHQACYHLAARNGHLHILKWLIENYPTGFNYNNPGTWEHAARGGQLETLKWLASIYPPHHNYPITTICFTGAAKIGRLDILKWLLAMMDPHLIGNIQYLGKTASGHAALGGYLDVLEWLYEFGAQISDDISLYATTEGHLHILQWLHQKGLLKLEHLDIAAINNNHLHILQWFLQEGFLKAERLAILSMNRDQRAWIWLYQNNIINVKKLSILAVEHNYLHVLQWFHQEKLYEPEELQALLQLTIYHRNLEVMKWLYSIKVPFKKDDVLSVV
jgi:hypothetical protein